MKRRQFLAAILLLASLLGCKSTQDTDTPPKKEVSSASPYTVSTDFSQLPGKIPLLLENLSITLVDKKETTGSCVYVGKSLSGHTVRVETTALVKGESVICTIVEGEKGVGTLLRNKINGELRKTLSPPRSR